MLLQTKANLEENNEIINELIMYYIPGLPTRRLVQRGGEEVVQVRLPFTTSGTPVQSALRGVSRQPLKET